MMFILVNFKGYPALRCPPPCAFALHLFVPSVCLFVYSPLVGSFIRAFAHSFIPSVFPSFARLFVIFIMAVAFAIAFSAALANKC